MGGFDFEWKGKTYDILTEGGCPFFETDEEEQAFEEWRKTPAGIQLFGPVPKDWSEEHYLDDRYPWDADRECRVDVEEIGKEKKHRNNISSDSDDDDSYDEADIDWFSTKSVDLIATATSTSQMRRMNVQNVVCFLASSVPRVHSEWVCGCDCEYCEYCEEQKKKKKKSKGGKKKK